MKLFESLKADFSQTGNERCSALYEAINTTLYSPADQTCGRTHVRDAINHRRVMGVMMLALLPVILMAIWNSGFQHNLTLEQMLAAGQIDALPGSGSSSSIVSNMLCGLGLVLPIWLTALLTEAVWVTIFAAIRKRPIGSGVLVTSTLVMLLMPATVPLWQVVLASSFGVILGREVFGGNGMNFLNPALVAWAFMTLAYPASMAGETVWTAVDGYSGATPLTVAASDGVAALAEQQISWLSAFVGNIPGSLGETSALACLIGALVLLITGMASWRVLVSIPLGVIIIATLFGTFNPDAISPAWHLVLGGLAFGAVFLATDPSASAITPKGQWIYGLLIGILIVTVRTFNPTMPESTGIIILFGSVCAPLIDRFIVDAHIKKRNKRHVQ